jgi:uncharacterized protein (TIGR03067 family)
MSQKSLILAIAVTVFGCRSGDRQGRLEITDNVDNTNLQVRMDGGMLPRAGGGWKLAAADFAILTPDGRSIPGNRIRTPDQAFGDSSAEEITYSQLPPPELTIRVYFSTPGEVRRLSGLKLTYRSYSPVDLPPLAEHPSVAEKERLRGKWMIESLVINGEAVDLQTLEKKSWHFNGGEISRHWSLSFEETGYGFDLDPTANPKTIDIMPHQLRPERPKELGIYQLDGDRLTICMAAANQDRPTAFASDSGSNLMLITLARAANE